MRYKENQSIRLSSIERIESGEVGLFLDFYDDKDNFIKRFKVCSLHQGEVLLPLAQSQRLELDSTKYELSYEVIAQASTKEDNTYSPLEVLYMFLDKLEHEWGKEYFIDNYADISFEQGLKLLVLGIGKYANKEFKLRLDNITQNEQLANFALNEQIAQIGAVAGFLPQDNLKNASTKVARLDTLKLALANLKEYYHFSFTQEPTVLKDKTLPFIALNFIKEVNLRYRLVNLPKDFYKDTSLPLLAFMHLKEKNTDNQTDVKADTIEENSKENNSDDLVAIALYLKGCNSYYMLGNNKYPLKASDIANIELTAINFYETFKEDITTKLGLLRFVLSHAKGVFGIVALVGILGALLSAVMPLATQYMVNVLIPLGNLKGLVEIALIVFIVTLIHSVIVIIPQIVMLFFSVKQYERFEAALYDKVLSLKISDLVHYERGDLANRLSLANDIQESIFKVISGQFTGGVFALASVVMMFYYSPTMAVIGVGTVLIYALVFFILSLISYKPLRQRANLNGQIGAVLTQFIDAVSKIRAAFAGKRVIARFMEDFGQYQKLGFIVGRYAAIQKVVSLAFPSLVTVCFYLLASGTFSEKALSVGVFMAFMTAFGSFQGGILSISSGFWTLLAIKPSYDRIYPLLKGEVEDSDNLPNIISYKGNVSCIDVSYRYPNTENYALNKINIEAKSGEFIAIVGPSGAGKSTLLRIILGFEGASGGTVLFDNYEISSVNKRSIRANLGVILQNDKIFAGTVADNILIGTNYTINDALEALEGAAFLDDIKAMPMGIHTVVTPDTISGGQEQRILIARAIVGKPKVIIMDESTSALDNISQNKICNYLSSLKVTRIVVAHRLSTIMQADRVYVLNDGKVEESGSPKELLARKGLFYNLCKRDIG